MRPKGLANSTRPGRRATRRDAQDLVYGPKGVTNPHMFEVHALWQGPFAWPRLSSSLPEAPRTPGVYLLTVEYAAGFLIYAAGITGRSVYARLMEHGRAYRDGTYNVLDAGLLRQGKRSLIWQGFWMKPRPAERIAEFELRRLEITAAVAAQLAEFRIFVANLGDDKRLRERVEAAIMNCLYEEPPPASSIPDRGMMLAPRRTAEHPVHLVSHCGSRLHGLPSVLVV